MSTIEVNTERPWVGEVREGSWVGGTRGEGRGGKKKKEEKRKKEAFSQASKSSLKVTSHFF